MEIHISIIVPVYNVARFLRKSINSILLQTKKEFELIAVDDGSTDDSLAILNEFAQKDCRIKILRQQKNSGVSAARNLGLDIVKGKYVIFLDADDYIDKNMLQKLYDSIEASKADAAICDFIEESEEGAVLKRFHHNLPMYKMGKEELNRKVLYDLVGYANEESLKNCLPTSGSLWSVLFRKELIQKNNIRFSSELFRAEDLLYKIEYLCVAQSLIAVGEPLYHYVRRNTSTTMTYNSRIVQNSIKYLALLRNILLKYDLLEECRLRISIKAFTLINFSIDYLCRFKNDMCFWQKRKMVLELLNAEEFSSALAEINGRKLPFLYLLRFVCYKYKFATIATYFYTIKHWRG